MLLKLLYTAIFFFGISDFANSNEYAASNERANSNERNDSNECTNPNDCASSTECANKCSKAMTCPAASKGASRGKPVIPVTPAASARPVDYKTPESLNIAVKPVMSRPVMTIPSLTGQQADESKTKLPAEKKKTGPDAEDRQAEHGRTGDFSPLLVAMYI